MPTRTFESKTIYKLNENEIMKRYKLGFEIEWNSVSCFKSQEMQNVSYWKSSQKLQNKPEARRSKE